MGFNRRYEERAIDSRRAFWLVFALGIAAAVQGQAATTQPAGKDAPAKPVIDVSKDGFPAGHETPEGAACDLARAFIQFDVKLFDQTCIAPFGGGENRAK